MEKKPEHSQLITFSTYVMVWLTLLILTGLTVTIVGLNLKNFAIIVAIFIAGFKSTLVLNYFMHLKYESVLFKNMVYVAIFTLVIIIALTFTDISFR